MKNIDDLDEEVIIKKVDENEIATQKKKRDIIKKGIRFLGVEGQSVGTREVHIMLLDAEVVILEGARLKNVPKGKYFLSAVPIKLGGSDGAPCRAILVDL